MPSIPDFLSQSVAISNDAERTAWASQLATLYRHMKKADPLMHMHVSARCSSLESPFPIEYSISFTRSEQYKK